MSEYPIVAVIGVGGQQNAAIASALASKGLRVRGIGRGRAGPSASGSAIEYRRADPSDRVALTATLEGAQIVVFTSPIDHRPGVRERLVENVVEASAKASVARIVFNAAAAVYDDRAHPVAKVLGALCDAVLAGPVPANVLQPTVYMDNLLAPWALPGIVYDGVLAYPSPEEAPVSWMSHRSLAEFAHAAATKDVVGRVFRIGGPEALTGVEAAGVLAETLGRRVRYSRMPPSAIAAGLNAAYGPPVGDDIAALYVTLEEDPGIMRRDPSEWAILGVVPETFRAWAKRQVWPANA